MPKEESEVEIIARLAAGYDTASDEQVLASVAALAPLADESDVCWKTEEYWRVAADPFLASSDVAEKRRLRPAVRLLLERACYGDPGEITRGLRHEFEAVFKPDWTALADVYLELARSPRLGTRHTSIASWKIAPATGAVIRWRPSRCRSGSGAFRRRRFEVRSSASACRCAAVRRRVRASCRG